MQVRFRSGGSKLRKRKTSNEIHSAYYPPVCVAVIVQATTKSGTGNLVGGEACNNLKYSMIPELSGMLLRVPVQRLSMNSDPLVPRLVY